MTLKRLYFDSESVGFYGMPVLFQWAVEQGPITLYDVWKHPIGETLDLIEWMLTHTMVFFNATFDMFHLCKCYTTFRLCPRDWIPEDHIDEIAILEPQSQDGPCLKPVSTLDLMLHSRKGKFQSLMSRDDVRIKKVPAALAHALAHELEKLVHFDNIYFAKSDPSAPRWGVYDRTKKGSEPDMNFKDVVLRFNPAGGLKFLAEYVLKLQPKYHYQDIEIDRKYLPKELGYAPTALATSRPEKKWEVYKDGKVVGYAWPGVIKHHIEYWATNQPAREYAELDIVYTRDLDKYFECPEPDDDDSVLACMVAAVRWHGFKVDISGIRILLKQAEAVIAKAPVNVNTPKAVRRYLYECMDETEKLVIAETTRKAKLEAVAAWRVTDDEECWKCDGQGCLRCGSTGIVKAGPHPAAIRATELLAVKTAMKERELYTKLLRAGKLHASFKVIGALSSRMAGADGLNPQGVKHTANVRSMFPLAWEGTVLSIGDFDSFEVTIADAVCDDPDMRADLQSGKKIHAIFGQLMYPEFTYDQIKASKDTANDMYTKGKQGLFATILYGGTFETLMNKLGVSEKNAKAAIENLLSRYKRVGAWRDRVFKMYCSMSQPGGIGSQVVWTEPADYCETFLGFRRYFTLENQVCKALFTLARKPPKEWKDCPIKVMRRNRVQTAGGAVASALYAAAFGIQAAAMRAAANHQIQSPGAQITKRVQRRIWELQPSGVHPFRVAPFQCHDEVAVVSPHEYVEPVAQIVKETVDRFRNRVPLISIGWNKGVKSWADKK